MYPIWPIFVTPVPLECVTTPLCVYIRTTHTRKHTHNYNLNKDQQAYDCATVRYQPAPACTVCLFLINAEDRCVMALLPHRNSVEAKFNLFPPACGFIFFNRMLH